jgi:hypothetical protein
MVVNMQQSEPNLEPHPLSKIEEPGRQIPATPFSQIRPSENTSKQYILRRVPKFVLSSTPLVDYSLNGRGPMSHKWHSQTNYTSGRFYWSLHL